MKNLIIHPKDPSTDFLSQIYALLPNKTVVKGGITKSELLELIEIHDRVIMLGHGSPYGLLNPGKFLNAGFFIIDESMVPALKNKNDNVYIWCNSDKFVQRHGLTGLNCGMFISEVREAKYFSFNKIDWELIDQSNERFASIVSKYINEPMDFLYQKLRCEYNLLARTNPISKFNLKRLYLTRSAINRSPNKVVVQ